MPQSPPNHTVNAWRALVRHAVMTEEAESGRRRPVLVRRRTSAALKMPVISNESRAQYECELTERAGRYLEEMLDHEIDLHAPQAADIRALEEADRLALDDLGCVEFWAHMQSTGGHCSIDERSPVELSERNENSIPDDFDFTAWWDSLEARLRGDRREAAA